MPRQNEYGKFILSAGEISTYEVCPEAWRLSHVQKAGQNQETPKKSKEGTCLLYTSPSPRDKRQSRMPSSA